jgi:hypothetical protein
MSGLRLCKPSLIVPKRALSDLGWENMKIILLLAGRRVS